MEHEPKSTIKEKLPEWRAREIMKKFRSADLSLEENEEFFIVNLTKNGEKIWRHIPKWETIDYFDLKIDKPSRSEKIEKVIESVFKEDENPDTRKKLTNLHLELAAEELLRKKV